MSYQSSAFAALVPFLLILSAGFLAVVEAQKQQASEQTRFRFQGCRPASIKHIVVFGDSFSDNGNVFELSHGSWPRSAFYYDGRFSNGPVWGDYISMDGRINMTNYAFGGATTDSETVQGYSGANGDIPVPGFIQQIEDYYLQDDYAPHTQEMNSTLFVINFQGNDFYFNSTIDTQTVLANIERGIDRLVDLGGRHLVVVENIDSGRLPCYQRNSTLSKLKSAQSRKQHTEYRDLMQRLAEKHGRQARTGSSVFYNCMDSNSNSAVGKKVNIAFFDLFALFERLYEGRQLKRMGISDVVHGCVNEDATKTCSDPGRHFYSDLFHPSTKVHREVANGLLQLL
ncbi:GDSL lipase/esterase [Gamsiella multidivaricata]|uniref:GDSL lipase/esterase n=1 Tax=Gamsiella multidivaricata TaxID=101098 RepID=UPI00221E41B9|nr:GDSL lipase/esterase [Gamsiella multidivaricata]KAG0370465.1 hypothetical protein BGZ54_006241 [Gamsiella multidivaricata]KAI7820255.1 GDSL lipase/esterase [Gamsiella multidivaricata]